MVLVFEPGTVTTTTVGEPFDPILWILVTCEGGVVGELCGCGVEFVLSSLEVAEVCVFVVPVVGVSFGVVEVLVSDVAVVGVVVGEVVGDDGTVDVEVT